MSMFDQVYFSSSISLIIRRGGSSGQGKCHPPEQGHRDHKMKSDRT